MRNGTRPDHHAADAAPAASDFRAAAWTLPGTFLGGHFQTVLSVRDRRPMPPDATQRVTVGEGQDRDEIALHRNDPPRPSCGNVLLLHGITGCHAAPYMKRLAARFVDLGWTTFRMDARGCGVLQSSATTITHAGRGGDVAAAVNAISRQSDRPIAAIGFSLGGNQLLQMLGSTPDSPSLADSSDISAGYRGATFVRLGGGTTDRPFTLRRKHGPPAKPNLQPLLHCVVAAAFATTNRRERSCSFGTGGTAAQDAASI